MANFCSNCGVGVAPTSTFCAECGQRLVAEVNATQPTAPESPSFTPPPAHAAAPARPFAIKDRTTAILLAAFLGYWTWLYTFKVDKVKFFSGLGAGFLNAALLTGISISNALMAGGQAQCLSDYYADITSDALPCYMDYHQIWWPYILIGLIALGMYVWVLVDTIRKKESFFANYPNQKR